MQQLDNYFERPSGDYERVLFLAGQRHIQSAEWNEMQTIEANRHRRLGDALFKEGAVVSGADVIIDADSGAVHVTGGAVYVRGDIRGVPAADMTIPTLGAVELGLRLTETVVTELDEPSLLNPAPGSGFHAPGAARLTVHAVWGWRAGTQGDGAAGQFYPVFSVTNGVLDTRDPPPQVSGVTGALARYDRAVTGSGSYVVSGLGVTGLSIQDGQQVFSLQEGRGHVDGYEVEKTTALRLAFPDDPDTQLIEAEPHTFLPVSGSMRLDLVNAPLASVVKVKVTAERTGVQIVHGAFTGAADALPDLSVLQIMSVTQGATTYVQGTDYKLTGNTVDWSPAGAEPAPGSTYTVTYRHYTDGTVTAKDARGFTVAGAVPGSVVLVDYQTKLPRRDRLVMNRDGQVVRVRGVADLRAPALPAAPSGTLPLATLDQSWFGLPAVTADAPRVMSVSDVQALSGRVDALFDLVATERLKTDATAREPAGAKGLFVDPLFDNDMRDEGITQSAAVIGGELVLPVKPVFPNPLMPSGDASMLAYALEPVVKQELATGAIKVNPYDSFSPIPCKVSVTVPVDRWTQQDESWDSASVRFLRTGHFVEGISRVTSTTTVAQSVETVRQTTTAAQYLRQIPLTVTVEHLGPGEIVQALRFDGVTVATNLTANASGVVQHTFTIPAGVPSGAKRIEAVATASGTGVTTFTGEGLIQTTVRRVVSTVEEFHVDPVAQSMTLRDGRHVGGVELMFRSKGASDVVVQIREMTNGFPGRRVLAEGRRAPSAIRTDGQPTRFEWAPVWMPADEEFAIVVLCDDADASVAIASLGEFDAAAQKWVTAQPYQIGVMFSSSNGTTWTAHQVSDLWFRLLGCRFTATSRVVPLGSLTASQVSDLVGLFNAERPDSATRIGLRLIAADGRVLTLSDGQPVNLTERLTGSVAVQLVLEGTDTRSPVVYPGVQAIFGVQTDTATYVSRQFACGAPSKLRVVLDAVLPGTAGVTVEAQAANGTWIAVPFSTGQSVGDGWEERVFLLTTFSAPSTRLRITMTGSALYRPRIRRIRAIAA
ncbi:hypothetical protein M2352_004351 [Azospirillum fermentarium]|uniref:DUF4815 domain-containing protein n=1 Tax=Azospirillum fermentarium TaxID=1233114 RepID=UPI002226114B|nr:DUF4815 domain-containing protein [Azospirillum fermentarium]MCW2248691.1 hypothetical protein [Azospirillum fermentarium]